MKRLFRGQLPTLIASLALTTPLWAQAAPLYITEFTVTPTAGEMVEIYNPGTAAVDLTDVYLTDATFAGGGQFYYNIVIGAPGGGSFGDFTARFPAGASIAPGEYQTVAGADADGAEGFFNTYGVLPTYEMLGDGGFDDLTVPNMLEGVPGSIGGQGGLTNSGEFACLFYWDGVSDLVTDLDYVMWGDTAEAVDKTGVSIDGPDADSVPSTYLPDTAVSSQEFMSAPGFGFSAQRLLMSEGTETSTGGNGVDGGDETSENLSATWVEATYTPNAATAGAVTLNITLASPGIYDFDMLGGTPNGLIVVFVNTSAGTTAIPQCPGEGLSVALDGSEAILTGVLDGNGELHVSAHMPAGLGPLHIQVADAGLCRFTNPEVITF